MIKTDLGSECARPIAKCDNVINTYCRTSNSCPFCPNNERCIVGLVCQGSQKTCVATAHNSQFCVRRKNGFVLNFFLYLMNWLRNKFGDKLPARPQSWSDVMRHPKRRPSNIKRTEKIIPSAHLAHLVLPDTQASPSQNQKS